MGEVAEWSKAHLWRRCVAVKLPWVQIPPSPPAGGWQVAADKSTENMSKEGKFFLVAILILAGVLVVSIIMWQRVKTKNTSLPNSKATYGETTVKLPLPRFDGETSLEKAIFKRRSIREYKDEPLAISEISQLLWVAQGVTDKDKGLRTAPSAGALYPLEVYLAVFKADGLKDGVYKYRPDSHELVEIVKGNKKEELFRAALEQSSIKEAGVVMVFAAVYERTTGKYGERGRKYVHIEVGHAAQNVYLQVVSLNLGTVVIGAFDDGEIKRIMGMPENEEPLYIMPVGVRYKNEVR